VSVAPFDEIVLVEPQAHLAIEHVKRLLGPSMEVDRDGAGARRCLPPLHGKGSRRTAVKQRHVEAQQIESLHDFGQGVTLPPLRAR
jgi:hypothetical protein